MAATTAAASAGVGFLASATTAAVPDTLPACPVDGNCVSSTSFKLVRDSTSRGRCFCAVQMPRYVQLPVLVFVVYTIGYPRRDDSNEVIKTLSLFRLIAASTFRRLYNIRGDGWLSSPTLEILTLSLLPPDRSSREDTWPRGTTKTTVLTPPLLSPNS